MKGLFSTATELWLTTLLLSILVIAAIPEWRAGELRRDVATAHARMGTLSSALEAYHSDHSVYPTDMKRGSYIIGFAPNALTTPIAYISVLEDLNDPLNDDEPRSGWPYPKTFVNRLSYYSSDIWFQVMVQGQLWLDYRRGWELEPFNELEESWLLYSYGPDLRNGPVLPLRSEPPLLIYYDPTNGTVSPGDMIRLKGGSDLHGLLVN